MKKVILATLVALACAAGSANAATAVKTDRVQVDVSNKVDIRHQFNEHSKSGKNGVDDSYDRFGVKAKAKLNDKVSVVGNYEGQVNLSTHEGARTVYGTRQLNAGLDAGQVGTVTIGRQTGAIYNVAGLSDIAPAVLSGYTSASDTGLMGRADSIVQYQNKIGNTTVTGQYKFAKDGRSQENHWKRVNEGEGYGVSVLSTDIGATGLDAGAAFASVDDARGVARDVFSLGVGYTYGPARIAATHTAGNLQMTAKQSRDDEVIAQYTTQSGVTGSLGYIDTTTGKGVKAVEVGAAYALNKNATVYADFGFDTTGRTDNVAKTGFAYKF